LTAFLKASAKEGLIKVKETKGEVVVTGAYWICGVRVCSRLGVTQVSTNRIQVSTNTLIT
jgi:hypothetical protein